MIEEQENICNLYEKRRYTVQFQILFIHCSKQSTLITAVAEDDMERRL